MISSLLEWMTIEFTVALTAAVPLIEVRGAIPIGVAYGLNPWHALLIALAGSMIPVPFILLFIRPIFKWMKTTKVFYKLAHKLTDKAIGKSDQVTKYGFGGLLTFVAIPLPGTGVWSGALVASLLDMKVKTALIAIFVGNIIAGMIITGLSYGVVSIGKTIL